MEQPPLLHDGGLCSVLNFRDVGATVNARLGRRLVREGLLFRSARPDEATAADRDRLRDHYGIRTVVDLRSDTERLRAAERRRQEEEGGDALAAPVRIPGVEYREVRITGRGFERHMLGQLGWVSFFKLIFLYAVGARISAVAILGREVMTPRGLLGLAADTLDASGPEVAEALRALLLPGAALVHCTQGKDRTGVVVALALLACGVPAEAAGHDYALTDGSLAAAEPPAARAARLAEIREMGLGDDFGRTADGFVEGVARHLDETYGGLEAYLDRAGFIDEERSALREKLLY